MESPVPFDLSAHEMSAQVELVNDLAGVRRALTVFRSVWGSSDVQDIDTYFAIASHGGYLAVAHNACGDVGASFGFRSVDRRTGRAGLHSHLTAVVPGQVGAGVGRKLKAHQRRWAAVEGLCAITWTFDPLQRRNGWFNLVVLGAEVEAFWPDLYGPLSDAINNGYPTDRFEVRLDVHTDHGATVEAETGDFTVSVPQSIDALRTDDPDEARRALQTLRDAFAVHGVAHGGLGMPGVRVRGMNTAGSYVLRPIDSERTILEVPREVDPR